MVGLAFAEYLVVVGIAAIVAAAFAFVEVVLPVLVVAVGIAAVLVIVVVDFFDAVVLAVAVGIAAIVAAAFAFVGAVLPVLVVAEGAGAEAAGRHRPSGPQPFLVFLLEAQLPLPHERAREWPVVK